MEDKLKEYGTSSSRTIKVAVSGAGVDKPGIYHVSAGCSLRDVIAQAKPNKRFSGRCGITRFINGDRITRYADHDEVPPLVLLHDDNIVAHPVVK